MIRHTIRAGRVFVGLVLMLAGGLLSLPGVPGPGILLVVGGLTLLGQEFEWAHRANLWLRRQGSRVLGKSHDRREGPPGRDTEEKGTG